MANDKAKERVQLWAGEILGWKVRVVARPEAHLVCQPEDNEVYIEVAEKDALGADSWVPYSLAPVRSVISVERILLEVLRDMNKKLNDPNSWVTGL